MSWRLRIQVVLVIGPSLITLALDNDNYLIGLKVDIGPGSGLRACTMLGMTGVEF